MTAEVNLAAKKKPCKHVWKWAHDDDLAPKVIYKENEHDADVICEGCGAQVPGAQYCTIVEEARRFLHLGEAEHVAKLQGAIDAYVDSQT